jgi:hypothetical protein
VVFPLPKKPVIIVIGIVVENEFIILNFYFYFKKDTILLCYNISK